MEVKNIKALDILSFAKFQAILALFVGFICGIIYSFGGLVIDALVSLNWMISEETSGLGYGSVLAFGSLVVMPILFLIAGFLLGVLEAILYNIFIKRIVPLYLKFN